MFDSILNNHPSVKATILQNDSEKDFLNISQVQGVLLEGSGVPEIDIQLGEGNYRFFTDTDFLKGLNLKPSALRGYFLAINNTKYEITQAKNHPTNYVSITKLILTKYGY